jgi:hypothetical protein
VYIFSLADNIISLVQYLMSASSTHEVNVLTLVHMAAVIHGDEYPPLRELPSSVEIYTQCSRTVRIAHPHLPSVMMHDGYTPLRKSAVV